MESSQTPQPKGSIPTTEKPAQVPVFNCHIYLSEPAADGRVVARCATLPEVQAEGTSQREAMQNAVAAFKRAIAAYLERGEAVPLRSEPLPREAGEAERLIAVHL